jgi:hypothetical protein
MATDTVTISATWPAEAVELRLRTCGYHAGAEAGSRGKNREAQAMKTTFAALALAPAVLIAAAPNAVWAQADARFAATTLDVTAEGEMKLPPDMATLSLGVTTTAPTAAEAFTANAAQMAKVMSALKASGLAPADIQTNEISLAPQYVYEQNQPPRLTGYQASNQVNVTEHDLGKLGRLVDAATGAGATNVGDISFGLANPVAAENEARVRAVKALEDKARLYADAAGYHVGRLVNLSEGGGYQPSPPRPMMRAMAVEAAPVTPVSTGELNIKIEISGTFELAK